jgi:hypothetical protein
MNLVTMTIVFEPSYCNVYGTGYQLRYVYCKHDPGIAVEYITGTSNLLSNLRSPQPSSPRRPTVTSWGESCPVHRGNFPGVDYSCS